MNSEFYINNRRVDLNTGAVIALTFAVNSLYEMKSVQGNISNRIVLPKTANNLEILGFAGDMNIDNKSTVRRRLPAKYIQNGVELIPDGNVEISNMSESGINVLLTSGNTDFFELITGSIRDLEFPEYDHTFDLATVSGTRFNSGGYIYPLIQYGQFADDVILADARHLRPATFVHSIVRKIVEQTGYKLINELENSPDTRDIYRNIVLPFAVDEFTHSKRYLKQYENDNVHLSANSARTYDDVFAFTLDCWTHKISDRLSLYDFGSKRFTANRVMSVNISVDFPSIFGTRSWLNGKDGGLWTLYKTGGVVLAQFETPFVKGQFSVVHKNMSLTAQDISLQPGEQIWIELTCRDNSTMKVDPGATFKITTATDKVIFGQAVQLESTLPDIPQREFLKTISALFCAIIQTDNKNRSVRIVPFEKIKDNLHIARDWSDRVVIGDEDTELKIGDYAQRNLFRWKEDAAIVPSDYGFGTLAIDDENLPIEKPAVDFPFAPSMQTNILGGVSTIEILKIEDRAKMEFKKKTTARIAMLQRVDIEETYTDGTVSNLVSGSIPVLYFYSGTTARPDLMLNSVLLRHYPDLTAVLNDQRRIVCNALLTEIDIQELDFFIPVYVSRFGSYFYVAKISNYVGNKPCKIDLIKLY